MVASVPVTPASAVGVPVVRNSGQMVAHDPVQALLVAPAGSLSKVYSVRPLASVSTLPSLVERVDTRAVEELGAAAEELDAAPEAAVLVDPAFDALEHPATPSAPAARISAPRRVRPVAPTPAASRNSDDVPVVPMVWPPIRRPHVGRPSRGEAYPARVWLRLVTPRAAVG